MTRRRAWRPSLDHNAWVERFRLTLRDGSFATRGQARAAVLDGIRATVALYPDPDGQRGPTWRRALADELLADDGPWLALRAGQTLGSLRRAAEETAWRRIFRGE